MRLFRFWGLLLPLLCAGLALPAAWADTFHLANGQVIYGRIMDMNGELIRYKSATGAATTLPRMQLAGRQDLVETHNNTLYLGKMRFVGNLFVELETPQGIKQVPRVFVKNIIMGKPPGADGAVIETDRQLQASPPVRYFP